MHHVTLTRLGWSVFAAVRGLSYPSDGTFRRSLGRRFGGTTGRLRQGDDGYCDRGVESVAVHRRDEDCLSERERKTLFDAPRSDRTSAVLVQTAVHSASIVRLVRVSSPAMSLTLAPRSVLRSRSIRLKRLMGLTFFAGLMGTLLARPSELLAQTYFSVRELLADQFAKAERVTYVNLAILDDDKKALERRFGVKVPKDQYTVYVATAGVRDQGYAVFDDELGQHEPITLGTFFDAQGKVTRVEVLAYREPFGDAVRSERFRLQFVGRDAHSGYRPGHDIDVISGATISTHSMARAVHRAAVLVGDMVVPQRSGESNSP